MLRKIRLPLHSKGSMERIEMNNFTEEKTPDPATAGAACEVSELIRFELCC